MAKNEVKLELLRQRLVRECDDFNTVDAFRLIDTGALCEVSVQDLVISLEETMRLQADFNTVELLLNEDGVMRYSDFCDLFVPKSQKVLQEL